MCLSYFCVPVNPFPFFSPRWKGSFETGRVLETRLSLNSLCAPSLSQTTRSIFTFFFPQCLSVYVSLSADASADIRELCQVWAQKQTWCCICSQSDERRYKLADVPTERRQDRRLWHFCFNSWRYLNTRPNEVDVRQSDIHQWLQSMRFSSQRC